MIRARKPNQALERRVEVEISIRRGKLELKVLIKTERRSRAWKQDLAKGQIEYKSRLFFLRLLFFRSDHFIVNNFNIRDQPVKSTVPPGLLPSKQHIYHFTFI